MPEVHPPHSAYRADIDGLRAVAVLLVVAYHLQLTLSLPHAFSAWVSWHISHTLGFWLSGSHVTGGFIGVDIFFVISGYLITGILLRELDSGTFSLAGFYTRRVRRIFPALAALLIFTSLVAWLVYTPYELRKFAQTALAALFSTANLFFWKTTGYFNLAAAQNSLLHTWSLSVEEQFYLLFPPLLALIHRFFRSRIKLILALAWLASFAASLFVYRDPTAAFFLPTSRAWELLTGSLLALNLIPAPISPRLKSLLSTTGLVLILIPSFLYTSQTIFPGPAALPPVIGAALILLAGCNGLSLPGRLFAWPPFAFIGLISYSLYLWHWPLLLLFQYEYFPDLRAQPWAILAVSLLAATLSWRFIEQPFRAGAHRPNRRQLFAFAAAATILLVALNGWILATKGAPQRLTPTERAIAGYEASTADWHLACFTDVARDSLDPSCLTLASGRPNYLLFGDSHAADLWQGLTAALPDYNWPQATSSSCPPTLENANRDVHCTRLLDTVFHSFLPIHHPDAILLSANWSPADLIPLGHTIAQLHAAGQNILVVGPMPGYDQPLPDLLIKALHTNDSTLPGRHLLQTPADAMDFDNRLRETALHNGAHRYISLLQTLCPGAHCMHYTPSGAPLLFDTGHLTAEGSLYLAQQLRDTNQLP